MTTFSNNVNGDENAIEGISVNGRAVIGQSETNYGMRASSKKSSGIRSTSDEGAGVEGESRGAGVGVVGVSNSGYGVYGKSVSNHGVLGESANGRGLVGTSQTDYGIRGHSNKSAGIRGSSDESRGVEGWATNSEGVVGISTNGNGVWGQTGGAGIGVLGTSTSGVGVWGVSDNHEGMHAETKSTRTAALAAYQMNETSETAALFVKHKGNRTAALFEGDVVVTGDIRLANADCAEDFDIADADSIEPGTVMVLGDDESLHRSCNPYDKRVAGVVSGAGEYKPGIVLDKQETNSNRKPIALLGKVYCKVDAGYASIEVGDLLTTSPSPGHAMKASDHSRSFGAVIGKALRSLKGGQDVIPILIALQ
jgi:hypothetical protein